MRWIPVWYLYEGQSAMHEWETTVQTNMLVKLEGAGGWRGYICICQVLVKDHKSVQPYLQQTCPCSCCIKKKIKKMELHVNYPEMKMLFSPVLTVTFALPCKSPSPWHLTMHCKCNLSTYVSGLNDKVKVFYDAQIGLSWFWLPVNKWEAEKKAACLCVCVCVWILGEGRGGHF